MSFASTQTPSGGLYPQIVNMSIKRPRGYQVGKILSDSQLKNTRMRKSSSTSSFSDKVHNLFENVVIVNSLKTMFYKAVMKLNYEKIHKLFAKEKRHDERIPNINSRFSNGNTVLHISAEKGHYDMCNLILDLGAKIDLTNTEGKSALHLAVLNHNIEIVDLLLSAGADIDLIDKDSNTPLMIAVMKNHTDIVEMLIVKHADISCKNDQMQTAYDLIPKIDTHNLFKRYFSQDEIKDNSSGYSRTQVNGHLLRNNRRDMTESILFKMKQYIDLQRHCTRFKIEDHQEISLPRRLSLNHFIIHELLGKGGFGEVYLVQQKKTNNYYALKTMEKRRAMKETSQKYVLNERFVYEKINHPFIIKFYRAFQTKRYLYLLCENASNGDLKGYLKKYKLFTEEVTKLIAAQIILALEHLHKKGIIYRDLKPENILIDKDGYIKLADFGLCKENIYGNRDTNSFCGSIAYLSPEIILREGHGKAVDWYLLGTVIYEMLVGISPYYTKRGKEFLIENIKFSELKIYNDKLTPTVTDLIRKLLNRNPDKRLGGIGDAEEIKNHPFFCNINFESIYYQHFLPPEILTNKISKCGNSNKLTESQWFINKELKNDMRPNATEDTINHIDKWDFEGFELYKEK